MEGLERGLAASKLLSFPASLYCRWFASAHTHTTNYSLNSSSHNGYFNLDDEAIYKKRANELDVVQNENKASTKPRSQAIAVRCTEKCTQPIFKAIIKSRAWN